MTTLKKQFPLSIRTWQLDFAAQAVFFLTLIGFGILSYLGGGVDFRGFYGAATLVMRSGNPYDYAQLAPVLEELTGFQGNNPFYYPPWYSLLFTPLTLVSYQLARAIWLGFSLVLFYISLEWLRDALNWGVQGWRRWTAYLTALLLFAVYCLSSEQAGILLLFGLSLTLWAVKDDRPALAGLGLIIVATKPQATALALIVMVLWLSRRKPSALLWAGGWIGTLLIAATAAIPFWWDFDLAGFETGLLYQQDGPGRIVYERVNSTAYDFFDQVFFVGPPLQYVGIAVAAVLGVALVVVAWYRFRDLSVVVAAAIVLTLLITPYALQYDYVPLTLAVFWILMHISSRRPTVKLAVSLCLMFSFSVLIWQDWSYQGYWQLLGIFAALSLVVVTEPSNLDLPRYATGL